eukprot:TRINITY_DN939_c0_g1_i1.p1 TRINITY_DN939_c0_g1~~TRINITY_DN939_c0_g1_i1.p1  ORF type:complete len:177 (-),score=18.05 TRINITY_DN939_c0_g1_i1:98-607(-)
MLWKDLMQHDNSFMFKYFVYVYYKKLGYVIHSGLKFSCHWLLYERKSETSTHEHAKFAVKIMISTTDEVKSNASTENQHDISWQMILSTNRVVENEFIICYVVVPSELLLSYFPDLFAKISSSSSKSLFLPLEPINPFANVPQPMQLFSSFKLQELKLSHWVPRMELKK